MREEIQHLKRMRKKKLLQLIQDCDNESRQLTEENARQSTELENLSKQLEAVKQQLEESEAKNVQTQMQWKSAERQLEESETRYAQAQTRLKDTERQLEDSNKRGEEAGAKIAILENTEPVVVSQSYEQAGSLAEAMLQVHGVATAAQQAADEYLSQVRKAEAGKLLEAEKVLDEARRKAALIITEAMTGAEQVQKTSAVILQNLQREVDQMLSGARDGVQERFVSGMSKIVSEDCETESDAVETDMNEEVLEPIVEETTSDIEVISEEVQAEPISPTPEIARAVIKEEQIEEPSSAVQKSEVEDFSALLSMLSQQNTKKEEIEEETTHKETTQSVNEYIDSMSKNFSAELGAELRKALEDLAKSK